MSYIQVFKKRDREVSNFLSDTCDGSFLKSIPSLGVMIMLYN